MCEPKGGNDAQVERARKILGIAVKTGEDAHEAQPQGSLMYCDIDY